MLLVNLLSNISQSAQTLNITGQVGYRYVSDGYDSGTVGSGAIRDWTDTTNVRINSASNGFMARRFDFDASRVSSIFSGNTVRPYQEHVSL